MPQPVFASPRVRLQIAVIADYLSEQYPAAAQRFRERLKTAYQQLSDFPLSGARGRVPGTRRLIVAPYILTYRIAPSGVEIIDIRHARQRPPAAEDTP